MKSAWVMRNAAATSSRAMRFILELLKVSAAKTLCVSLRASKAATTSISENATSPIERPVARLLK